jgi:hypothetical protein
MSTPLRSFLAATLGTRPERLARIPLRHLASLLGVTDLALSRIRRRLNPG